ncbi:MAG: RNA polymerase sigma factor [Sciscionella sp.]
MRRNPDRTESETGLVARAASGDEHAWRTLVDRHGHVPWVIARQHGLCHADAADVSQTTWLRLATGLHALRDPSRLVYWLATTARRESLRLIATHRRESPEETWEIRAGTTDPPDIVLLGTERDTVLWHAFAALPDRCRQILKILAYAPDLSYAQIGRAIGISPHSVGPNRRRCLDQLRRKVTAAGIFEEAG